ncbi:AraC family transcriptional regulator [Melittangium boletus DSM 14713]|uniref:AraC family transcriptional regulator n=2 Tax=Melittangium boletus TaxID=83453 RepID=A0A250IPI8_9BACT|nr:AraC family transcriptional regulator [Melittangium boletus DSM 14713]
MTLTGVQTFRYRGERRHCLAGEGHILHPDELHDGGAGTEEGFGYRILYVDPSLVQQALDGKPLPFVADPVVKHHDMDPALIACLNDIDEPIGDCERVEIALVIAGVLEKHSSAPRNKRVPLCMASLLRVRDLIADDPMIQHPVKEFERVSGLDRWTIARQFRAAFGTSPSRFRTMRQLDLARLMIIGGMPLRDAALEAGFADQSHLSRMFKRTYGLTPARWAAALT